MLMITSFSDNIVEEGLQMMHHTKFFKRWLAQPRLLLRTVLLGMLLTGCFAAMAGLGASMASAQSSPGQNRPHTRPNQGNQDQGNPRGQESPTAQTSPTAQASPAIAGSNLSGAGAPPTAPGAA